MISEERESYVLYRTALLFALLAPAIALADFQPVSGQWRHQISTLGAAGCPAGIAQQQGDQTFDVHMDIPKPFHPTGRGNQDMEWTRLGEDRWRGVKTESRESPEGMEKVEIVYSVTVHSPRHITQETSFTMTVPASVAAKIGMAETTCRTRSKLEQRYLGE